jgi:hypothetical protein
VLLGVGASLADSSACMQEKHTTGSSSSKIRRREISTKPMTLRRHPCRGLCSWGWAPHWQTHQPACMRSAKTRQPQGQAEGAVSRRSR